MFTTVILALTLVLGQTGSFNATFPPNGTAVGTKDANGKMQPIRAAADGSTAVSVPEYQRGAFGGLLTSQDEPQVALSFNYNINTFFVTTETANGGTVTQSNSKAVLQTSTATNGSAHLHSKAGARYTPGQGVIARFTAVFTPCVASSTQEIGIGDEVDGFYFGCNGASFGVLRRQNGADTWVAKTAWNTDRMAGGGGILNPSAQTLDITKGNVYVIQFQWLGFGAIRFFIENAATGALQLVHVIRYSNANTDPSVFNPTLPLHVLIKNTGNATNLTLQTASMGAYLEGPEPKVIGALGSSGNSKSVTSELALVSIRNNATFQGKTNRVRVKLKLLNYSGSSAAAADCIFRGLLNTTLGGAPSFTDFDTNTSVVATDTAGTTVTGGRQILRLRQQGTTSDIAVIDTLEMHLNPGDIITFSAASTGAAQTCEANVTWLEEFGG